MKNGTHTYSRHALCVFLSTALLVACSGSTNTDSGASDDITTTADDGSTSGQADAAHPNDASLDVAS
ncbi:MAG: hypothetical protein QF464_03865, partial [Myxococcota bacterium]|nr:hypothetical protein [Myxococcota bacterium]